ncbi:MAG: galactokinase [Thermoguttaceae bacterium]|nr:galactokinase [Thermoguttaceae bacterium]
MADQLFDNLVADAKKFFRDKFNCEPTVMVAAPGRVNLIGEHTDYNGGYVFPMAIERYTVIAATPTDSDKATIWTKDCGKMVRTVAGDFTLSADVKPGPEKDVDWASYVQGTISCCLRKGATLKSGFNAAIVSNVPLGGGLSSSASLEVSVATLIEELGGHKFQGSEKPLLCVDAEHEYAHMPCGIMDQFISALGQKDCAMLLDCLSEKPEMVPMNDPTVSVLITNSNVKHELTGSEYPERRASCKAVAEALGRKLLREVSMDELLESKDKILAMEIEEKSGDSSKVISGETLFKRARHAVGEDVRTLKMKEALIAGDWATVGEQMYASHDSLRDDYGVSCVEIDALVEIARSIGPDGGVIGSRITGGGFGGCTVTLVKTDKADEIAKKIAQEYKTRVGKDATIFVTRPAQGAFVL